MWNLKEEKYFKGLPTLYICWNNSSWKDTLDILRRILTFKLAWDTGKLKWTKTTELQMSLFYCKTLIFHVIFIIKFYLYSYTGNFKLIY